MQVNHLNGSYQVVVERGALSRINDYAPSAVVTTEKLWKLFGPLPGTPIFIPDGEPAKEASVLQFLWQAFYDHGLDSRSVIIALGGGSVGDVAGFAAATFMRGIDIIQVPTTLLGMVDSAIGGKTAINFSEVKNGVGAIHHPVLVLADPNCLDTLPPREMASGMAEAIKSAVIGDPELFNLLEQGTVDIETVIQRSAEVKIEVVNGGVRDHLNYGHTFAHALETLSNYSMVHGEAVSIGMNCAASLSLLLGRAGEDLVLRQEAICKAAGLPTELPNFPAEQIIAAMRRDKKSVDGQLRLVLPKEIGKVSLVEGIADDLVASAIEGCVA